MMMQMHVISAIRWWMDGWSKDLNVQTPEKELTPIINNDLVHKWLPGVASREKVLQRQRLPNRRSLCSLDHHPKIWWSCVSLVGPHYNAKREGLLASAVLRSMDLDIQGALFYCSSRFSVTTWKIMSCSQPELLFQEFFNLKKLFVKHFFLSIWEIKHRKNCACCPGQRSPFLKCVGSIWALSK